MAEDSFVSEVKKDFGGGGLAKDKPDLDSKIGNIGKGLTGFYKNTRKALGMDKNGDTKTTSKPDDFAGAYGRTSK